MADVLEAVTDLTETEDQGFFHLSYSERMIGGGICALCGLTAGILSIVSIFILNMRKFVVLFTISNILFLVSLCLIVGFKKILSSCADKKRLYAGIGMFVGSLCTLFFGIIKKWWILSILSFLLEFGSFIYYALSFIPGGEALFHFLIF